jgi:two-component system, OmpR family, response regulator RegX3
MQHRSPGEPTQILVVEEEPLVQDICDHLRREGFQAVDTADGIRGLELFRHRCPALVVLGSTLPGINGLVLCRIIRAESRIPIIILSSKNDADDRVAAFELGADDYVTKPCSMRELVTRVRAQLRRAMMPPVMGDVDSLVAGPIRMDVQQHEVHVGGKPIDLVPKEFALLEALMLRRGRLVPRWMLLSEVWGPEYPGDARTLDAHISRLRAKIEEEPGKPRHVKTVRGLGYKLEA